MRVAHLVIIALLVISFSACTKNTTSKIPFISLKFFGFRDGTLIGKVNKDTAFLQFDLADGDADLGRDDRNDIYVQDNRFPGTYTPYAFPVIDPVALDPKKGVEGTCTFIFTPDLITPRTDSLHKAVGDTMSFNVYIVDKAGHNSDTIVTPSIVVHP
jgi:hypothetical protein